jgi:tetratricopeptide (TPR) repeat protein
MLKRSLSIFVFALLAASSAFAQVQQPASDLVLVLPFENTSGRPEFNWVGESFADSLSDLLKVPGLNVVSNEKRKLVQQSLGIPLSTLPSLATSLKLARESNATLLISGNYNIVPAGTDTAATIRVMAKIIRVNEGRFLSEVFPDGSQKIPPLELNDALGNLQTMQGQIAYRILYFRDKSGLAYSQNDMVVAANKVPARAFEAYIKGLLTPSAEARENYFKNASRLYTEATPEGTYSEAALELGHLYLGQRKYSDAVSSFERVISASQTCRAKAKADNKPAQCGDESYAEASFYIGLIFWQQGNYETALATLRPLIDDLKLTTVYNALGAIAVEASKAEKKNQGKAAALLTEGVELLKKASDSTDNPNVHFNYAASLFLSGNMNEAATQLRSTIAAKPRDGDAYFLLAKALDSIKDPLAAKIDDQAKIHLTANNRYAKLETEWQKSKTVSEITLRVEQPSRRDFVSVVLSSKQDASTVRAPRSETDSLLEQARILVKNGNDDEAMTTLRRVLISEPMSAESHLLLGRINLRRGDIDQAISHFKTSIFWDNRLIEAYVSLGKIYVERGDCLQAKNYAASVMEINSENQDALALQRLSERCSK